MAEWTPPYIQQNADHGSALLRNLLSHQSGKTGFTMGENGGLLVTQDTGSNMNCSVAPGAAIVMGDEETLQGAYFCLADAAEVLTHDPAHVTYDRVDVVAATVRDSYYSGGDDDWILEIVKGAEDGSDVAPALNANSLKLAEVDIDTGTTAITTALCTDKRLEYPIPPLVTDSSQLPASSQTGAMIFESDTGLVQFYDGAAWNSIDPAEQDRTTGFFADKSAAAGVAEDTWTWAGSMTERAGAANFDGVNVFTAPAAGMYLCLLNITTNNTADDFSVNGRIVSNYSGWISSPTLQGSARMKVNRSKNVNLSGLLPCSSGGTLTWALYHDHSTTTQFNNMLASAQWYSDIPT